MKRELIDRLAIELYKTFKIEPAEVMPVIEIALAEYTVAKAETALAILDSDINDTYLKKFLVSKKVKGCTDRTIEFYQKSISKAFERIGKVFTEITADDITLLSAFMLREGQKRTSVGNVQRNLSSFFLWATKEELIQKNPFNKIDIMKPDTKKEYALTDIEIEKMRAVINNMEVNYRSKYLCLFEVLLSTGCRAAEVASIKIDDIKGDTIEILGKGEKWRKVYLNAKAKLAIEKFLSERSDINPYLFPRTTAPSAMKEDEAKEYYRRNKKYIDVGKPMSRGTPNFIVKKIGKEAGIDRKVHTHLLRKTCATNALRNGMPIEQVSQMLGHEQIDTTKIYITIADEELANSHKRYVR